MRVPSEHTEIPSEILLKWQEIVNVLAEVMHVPATLVMQVEPPNIKVFLSSESTGNPYEHGELASLNTGLYCETVMRTRQPLLVPDALVDEEWKSNPDIKLGMISYLGFPIAWPDGEIFGTICALDNKKNDHGELHRKLLAQFRDVLQEDLRWLTTLGSELTTQKAQLDELFAVVPEAIVMVDAEERVLRVNGEFTHIFGYSADEAVGSSLHELIVPEDLRQESQENATRVTKRGEILNVETVRRRKDGTRVPVSVVGVPASPGGGQVSGWLIYRDITRRRRLEAELKDERDRLRLLLDLNNSVVSQLDLRQLFEALSGKLLSIMHCDQAALLLPENGQLRTEMLYLPSGRGFASEGMIVPLKGSVSGKVFRTKKPLRIGNLDDLRNDPEAYANADGQLFYQRVSAEGLKSGCFLPLITRDKVVGVLHVCKRPENAFTEEDLEFLEQIARQVAIGVENALEYRTIIDSHERLAEQKQYLQDEILAEQNFGEIVGASSGLKAALAQVTVVAPTDSSVLILGETGTGKELVARAIHDISARRDRPFVKLNCAAIPLGLLESELFGHEKGAFTGAISQKMGRFELANKGTLFLDEVGDIPLELQAKLLRVLQEQEFERLGSNRTHKVDVRIVAATHRDLGKMVKQQTFREDLYYRLKVFPISVPPLRERAEDIPQLVRHFASRYARKMNKKIDAVPPEVMSALVRYSWPGNVRELQNFIERAVILSRTSTLHAPIGELAVSEAAEPVKLSGDKGGESERDLIIRALEESNWVVGGPNGAAARLGLARTSLVYKMQKLRISRGPRESA
jgi:formate hydrogenlyase transcriptional activator